MQGLANTLMSEGGIVMWPLLVLSLFGFVIFMERVLFLHRGQIRTNDFIAGIKNLLAKRRLVEALTVCEETPGPVPIILKAALLNYDRGEETMRHAIQSAAVVEIPTLERRVGSLAAIGRVSPLLGLLGTIIGLMRAFYELELAGPYAHSGVLASGFGEALASSAVGLLIAVMAFLAHHFLHGRVRALVHDMEYAGHDLMQYLLRDLPEDQDGPAPGGREEPAEIEEAVKRG